MIFVVSVRASRYWHTYDVCCLCEVSAEERRCGENFGWFTTILCSPSVLSLSIHDVALNVAGDLSILARLDPRGPEPCNGRNTDLLATSRTKLLVGVQNVQM